MGFLEDVKWGSATEIGRRHAGGVAFAVGAARALPALLVVGVLGAAGWAVWHWSAWLLTHLLIVAPLGVAAFVAAGAVSLWRRFGLGELVEIWVPVEHAAAFIVGGLVVASGAATAAIVWLA